jgi:hypothetical protein
MIDTRSPFRNEQEAIEFLKRIGMKHRRLLEGTEREHIITLLKLLDPVEISNNQRTFTETYYHAGKEYELTWGFGSDGEPDPWVEEITEYDIQQNKTT